MGHHFNPCSAFNDWIFVRSHTYTNVMKKNILASVVLFVSGICAIGGLLFATTKVVYRDRKIEKEIETLKQEAQRIKSDNQILSERIAYFETPDFQEKVAKEKLNMQKEGEGVAIIKSSFQEEPSGAREASAQVQPSAQIANHIKWWNYFFEYKN